MLYIVRKIDESIIINNDIEVKVIAVKKGGVKLGLNFPNSASVLRKEIYENMEKENVEALAAFDAEKDGADNE